MKDRIKRLISRHPAVMDALIWALPAILIGLALRVIFLAYHPLAYWGSDSESYFSFAYRLLHEGILSIPEKRRYVYPLLLLPVSVLPGSVLGWLAIFQHAMGLLTLLPLAYAIRKIFAAWKCWIVPLTVIYAGMPIVLWYEHELLGEAFFFATLIWAFAAWVAWVSRIERKDPAPDVWWIFLACLALCVLTKPAARFFWPGLVIGIVYVRAWRFLRWPQWTGLGALIVAMLTMGDGKQAARLLYSSAFPLTVLESSRHADLKADVAALVRANRARLDYYYYEDNDAKNLLRRGYRTGNYPAWQALEKNGGDKGLSRAMRDLALEAIFAYPVEFIYIGVQRAVSSINWTIFKIRRYEQGDYMKNFGPDFADRVEDKDAKKLGMIASVFDVEPGQASSLAEYQRRVEPAGREVPAKWMNQYVAWATSLGVFVAEPFENGFRRTLWQMTPTLLGWFLVAGCLLALALPQFRATLGVWVILAVGYALTVYLVGSSNPRFFAAAWPPLLLALAVPLDVALQLAPRVFRRRASPEKYRAG